MSALPERKIAIVQALVQTSPDNVVSMLEQALSEVSGDTELADVRRLVETEVNDRRLRNLVLQPLVPLFVDAAPGAVLQFPPRALGLIWRALNAAEPEAIALIRDQASDAETSASALSGAIEVLMAAAASGLHQRRDAAFAAVAAACDAHQPGGGARLGACLDIAPVVRRAVQRLPQWIMSPDGDTAAAARIAHRDAVAISDEAGPTFFHMLAAHLANRWMVLRIISAVMDRPTERYLADSELAGFGEAVLADVDQLIADSGRFDASGGPEAGRSAAERLGSAIQQILEVETSVDLTRDQGWGKRIVKQRAAIVATVETWLRRAEKALPEVLPRQDVRGARGRAAPCLERAPDLRELVQAQTLLAFVDELRTSMNPGGFASLRAKSVERLTEFLDQYTEDALDLLRREPAKDPEAAYAVLQAVATLTGYMTGPKAAELVLRRAGVAMRAADAPAVASENG